MHKDLRRTCTAIALLIKTRNVSFMKFDLDSTTSLWEYSCSMYLFLKCFILTTFDSQLNKLVALVNAVFAKQGRKFKKDEKVLAYPSQYYSRLFNFYDNMTKT